MTEDFRTRAPGYGGEWVATTADGQREAAIAHARTLGRAAELGVTIQVEYGWSWRVREVDGDLAAVVSIDSAKALAKSWRWERADTGKRIKMSLALMPRGAGARGLLGLFTWGPAQEPRLGDDIESLRDWVAEQARQLGAAADAVLVTSVEVNLDLDHDDAEALVAEMLGGVAR